MKKSIMKRALALLLVLVTLVSLFACVADEPETDTEESQATQETVETATDSMYLPISTLSEYSIIFPGRTVSKEVIVVANDLKEVLEKMCGAEIGFRDDFIYKGKYEVSEYEILIADTNRDETALVYSDLKKYDDYEVRLCGKKIVVAGMNDAQVAVALRDLVDAIKALSAESKYFFDGYTMQTSFVGTYTVGEMKLGDTSISEYLIVHKNNSFGKQMAEDIYNSVLTTVGYALEMKADINVNASPKKIIIGDTMLGIPEGIERDVSGQYAVCYDGNDVYLYANNNIGVYNAVQAFVGMINSSKGTLVDFDPNLGTVTFEDESLTSMSFNLWVKEITTERKARVFAMIEKYMPDTIGVQEANSTWIKALEKEFGDIYAHVGIGRDSNGSGERSSVFYKKEKFKLLDSGTKWMSSTPDKVSKVEGSICNRVFSYALLECKSDGKQFMHVNVHTDHTSDENVRLAQVTVLMNFVKQHSDKAILISGDFNSQKGTTTINHVLSMVDNSADVALVSTNSPTFSTKIIDYIFVTKGDFEVFEYWVDNSKIDGEYPSDHYPVLIKYNIK